MRRRLIRLLPPGPRSLFALPRAVFRSVRIAMEDRGAHRALLARLPRSIRPGGGLRMFLARTRTGLSWGSWNDRDQFAEPRWRRRVRWRIDGAAERAINSGQPVVLATAHYGAMILLGRWLYGRGAGVARVAVLADEMEWMGDPRGPEDGRHAPMVFTPSNLRGMREFLAGGGVLIVAVDFPRGKAHPVRVEDRDLLISTGALRLAAWHSAAVVPCVAAEKWWYRGEVELGAPLEAGLVADPSRHPEACDAIAAFLMRAIANDPLQCSDILLARFVDAGAGSSPHGER